MCQSFSSQRINFQSIISQRIKKKGTKNGWDKHVGLGLIRRQCWYVRITFECSLSSPRILIKIFLNLNFGMPGLKALQLPKKDFSAARTLTFTCRNNRKDQVWGDRMILRWLIYWEPWTWGKEWKLVHWAIQLVLILTWLSDTRPLCNYLAAWVLGSPRLKWVSCLLLVFLWLGTGSSRCVIVAHKQTAEKWDHKVFWKVLLLHKKSVFVWQIELSEKR